MFAPCGTHSERARNLRMTVPRVGRDDAGMAEESDSRCRRSGAADTLNGRKELILFRARAAGYVRVNFMRASRGSVPSEISECSRASGSREGKERQWGVRSSASSFIAQTVVRDSSTGKESSRVAGAENRRVALDDGAAKGIDRTLDAHERFAGPGAGQSGVGSGVQGKTREERPFGARRRGMHGDGRRRVRARRRGVDWEWGAGAARLEALLRGGLRAARVAYDAALLVPLLLLISLRVSAPAAARRLAIALLLPAKDARPRLQVARLAGWKGAARRGRGERTSAPGGRHRDARIVPYALVIRGVARLVVVVLQVVAHGDLRRTPGGGGGGGSQKNKRGSISGCTRRTTEGRPQIVAPAAIRRPFGGHVALLCKDGLSEQDIEPQVAKVKSRGVFARAWADAMGHMPPPFHVRMAVRVRPGFFLRAEVGLRMS
ncbi:hypothetical protein FB451DRAFT_1186244 [Mycena latifolia]|nr:hypothetical protein FB451DRAFT_1186244 [Mycena latifolia]